MVFGLFKKKDPICGMKEEAGKGFIDNETGNWFCSQDCKNKYYTNLKKEKTQKHGGGCCCH